MNDLRVKTGDLIAVYGLLRSGQSGFVKFDLADAFEFVEPCEIYGQMFDMGGFPGLFAGSGRIIGDIYRITDASVMAKLDAFEDFGHNHLINAATNVAGQHYPRLKTPMSRFITACYHIVIAKT